MDERTRRLWAACEAAALGRGGVTAVAEATGMSRTTIRAGIVELKDPQGRREAEPAGRQRVRRAGGGRKRLSQRDRKLLKDLEALVEPSTRGDPQSPLRWTCKSTRHLGTRWLAADIRSVTARWLLCFMDWTTVCRPIGRRERGLPIPTATPSSSTSARKSVRSKHSNSPSRRYEKERELVGDFRNVGLEWQPQGSPDKVRVHDFKDKELGKAIPYGIDDITNNEGWVSVGIDHDTAQFATATLKRWWHKMGSASTARPHGC